VLDHSFSITKFHRRSSLQATRAFLTSVETRKSSVNASIIGLWSERVHFMIQRWCHFAVLMWEKWMGSLNRGTNSFIRATPSQPNHFPSPKTITLGFNIWIWGAGGRNIIMVDISCTSVWPVVTSVNSQNYFIIIYRICYLLFKCSSAHSVPLLDLNHCYVQLWLVAFRRLWFLDEFNN
jgi:hypothetical protein